MWATVRFLVMRWVFRMLRFGPNAADNDLEIAVLRHQLAILQRQVPRPRYQDRDRRLLSILARHLPRERWGVFLVTPATLLRWQRRRIRRHWTRPQQPARLYRAKTLDGTYWHAVRSLGEVKPPGGTR